MENRTEFDLKPGEYLTVKEGYVSVYSDSNKEYRYYCLNGKHIVTFTEEQIERMQRPACIFLKNKILFERENDWMVMDYNGNKIAALFVREVFVAKNNVLLIWRDDSMTVYSCAWKLLLGTKPGCKLDGLADNYIAIFDLADGYERMYDLRYGKFIGKDYTEVVNLYSMLIAYPDGKSGKCSLFNATTCEFEEQFDSCTIRDILIEDELVVHAIFGYRDGKCGLWFASESFCYRILPTVYSEITVEPDGITARCGESVVKFEAKNFSKNCCCSAQKKPTVVARAGVFDRTVLMYRGVEIKEGQELSWLGENFFMCRTPGQVAKVYTHDGKYVTDWVIIP